MKNTFRLFRRGSIFWCQHNYTGKQETLKTKDRDTALRLLHAKNEAERQPALNIQIARAYLASSDPQIATRTWNCVMQEMGKHKTGATLERWNYAIRDEAFDLIRDLPILGTRSDHLLKVLERGTVSTNVFLRRMHNFAIDMAWLPWPLLPRKRWPAISVVQNQF